MRKRPDVSSLKHAGVPPIWNQPNRGLYAFAACLVLHMIVPMASILHLRQVLLVGLAAWITAKYHSK